MLYPIARNATVGVQTYQTERIDEMVYNSRNHLCHDRRRLKNSLGAKTLQILTDGLVSSTDLGGCG